MILHRVTGRSVHKLCLVHRTPVGATNGAAPRDVAASRPRMESSLHLFESLKTYLIMQVKQHYEQISLNHT